MVSSVLLNNVTHKNLKVITKKHAQYGHKVGNALAFPTEFAEIQREYPILFQKHPDSGSYQSVALLGFNGDENLFLEESGWSAHYVPAIIEKGPFLIGLQRSPQSDQSGILVNIDMDDPRVNQEDGEALFLEFGGNSPFLDRIRDVLRIINDGVQMSRPMFAAFEALELLEPVSIEYSLKDGVTHKLEGFETINTDRLANLGPEDVFKLHRSGFLRAAYFAAASLANLQKLVDKKNKSL